MHVKPKKHFGQHFLTDPGIAERISGLTHQGKNSLLIEIGPGKGILTDFLIKQEFGQFLAYEIDKEAVSFLNAKYQGKPVSIIHKDFLSLGRDAFSHPEIAIVGNFPYNISSQIFFKVLENRNSILHVACMIQKEVAERIISPPGSKTYGILSVLLQAFYTTKMQFSVKPGSFHPPPKVNSSVITLQRNETQQLECDEALFFRVVKATFNQRRKTIRNSLKTILLNLGDNFELLSKRPEQLGVNEFVELTNWVSKKM